MRSSTFSGQPPALGHQLRRAVERRALKLADGLDRKRTPRNEVTRLLTEAFAGESDNSVYEALLSWIKTKEQPSPKLGDSAPSL